MSIEELTKVLEKLTIDNSKIIDSVWESFKGDSFKKGIKEIEYLLKEFGTKEPCNRFDIGNVIEFILGDVIRSSQLDVDQLPNSKRVDICINGEYEVSIKYSSIGNITLHNSNGHINKDLIVRDTILLTPTNLYFIISTEVERLGVKISDYLINAGDSLKLKRSFLRVLSTKKYKYIFNISLNIDKSLCKNRLCSQLFYQEFKREYNESLK